ncbi:MAG: DNA recombination protein RmuC [Gammaproteobacteria bacterium]|nr:DNA recombination protein RmuC [Gammaproteobacteria bacterium]
MSFFTQLNPLQQLYVLLSAAALAGLLLGLFIQYLFARTTRTRLEGEIALRDAQIRSDAERAAERDQALDATQQALKAVFGDLARESLEQNSENFLRLAGEKFANQQNQAKAELGAKEKAVEALVKPLQEALDKTHKQINELEKTRQEAYGNLTQQLSAVHLGQESLRAETNKLVSSLRQPNVRGQWGELTLRRLAELAGMVDRCDFAEQVHVRTEGSDPNIRPDMVIHLPEKGQLVVDVKTPLEAYLKAVAEEDEDKRKAFLEGHARNLANHVKTLASKAYFDQFEHSPEFVILFVPGDQFLSAALDVRPALLDEALRSKVLLVTPTSLVALLKVVAYGWMQFKLEKNAEEIRDLAIEMHKRIGTFTGHLDNAGKKLSQSVKAYNDAIGSLESRVMPNVRTIESLGANSGKDIPSPSAIDITARELKLVVDDLQTDTSGSALPPAEDDNDELHP